MKAPSNFMDIVREGGRLLQSLGRRLRVRAEETRELPGLWLSVRDFEGLAARLMGAGDWEWRNGFASLLIGGQDFGLLDDLLSGASNIQPALTPSEQDILRALREFLQQACDRQLTFDEPTA